MNTPADGRFSDAVREETARLLLDARAMERAPSVEPATRSPRNLARTLWIGAGLVSLGLGLAGIPLPLLPTTPFILLSALCFARGSQRLHGWLMSHHHFGPMIRDWNRSGAISPRAKRLAATAMATALLISFAVGVPWTILTVQATTLGGAAIFILTRPSPPT